MHSKDLNQPSLGGNMKGKYTHVEDKSKAFAIASEDPAIYFCFFCEKESIILRRFIICDKLTQTEEEARVEKSHENLSFWFGLCRNHSQENKWKIANEVADVLRVKMEKEQTFH